MRRGFTLVELSIVLVIIGLLIGGILVAQSMIETAKVQSMIRQLQQFHIAATNFKTSYIFPAGDSRHFTPPGNENSHTRDGWNGCDSIAPYSDSEYIQSWAHLSQAGMLKGDYRPWQPNACGGTDDDSPFVDSIAYGPVLESKIPSNHLSYMVNQTGDSNPYGDTYTGYVFAWDSIAIDSKLDDGMATTGSFRSSIPESSACDGGTLIDNGYDLFASCNFHLSVQGTLGK